MVFRHAAIDLGRIRRTDNTYRITTRTEVDDLVASIRTAGLVAPPVVIRKADDFVIVCGFRRIEALRQLNKTSIEVRIVPAGTSRLECVKLAIADNAAGRPLNIIETSRALNLIAGCFEDDRPAAETAAALGLPENSAAIEKIRPLCQLPMEIQTAVLAENVSFATALQLGRLDRGTGIALALLFTEIKASLNKQREILTLITEIAVRETLAVREVVGAPELRDIIGKADMDRNQKAGAIRSYLKRRRYPAIVAAEKNFDHHLKQLKLGQGMKLVPPRHFEGPCYTLSLTFKNVDELSGHRDTLDRILSDSVLDKILS